MSRRKRRDHWRGCGRCWRGCCWRPGRCGRGWGWGCSNRKFHDQSQALSLRVRLSPLSPLRSILTNRPRPVRGRRRGLRFARSVPGRWARFSMARAPLEDAELERLTKACAEPRPSVACLATRNTIGESATLAWLAGASSLASLYFRYAQLPRRRRTCSASARGVDCIRTLNWRG
jgi:hypothetical protein